jgi:feruloyl esterase
LNVTEHDFSKFGLKAVAFWDSINPGGIATFDGDLSAFRNRGGKFLTYHGRRDPVCTSTLWIAQR